MYVCAPALAVASRLWSCWWDGSRRMFFFLCVCVCVFTVSLLLLVVVFIFPEKGKATQSINLAWPVLFLGWEDPLEKG